MHAGVLFSVACVSVLAPAPVWAGERGADIVPAAPELPERLSLEDALRMFETRGLDLLLGDAATRMAEGAAVIAGAVANPVVSASAGNAFTYSTSGFSRKNCLENGAECSPWSFNVGITDSAAIEDLLTGKRELRLKVARNALAASKMSRQDMERTIGFEVKSIYVQVATAFLALKFARDVAATQATTLRRFQDRYRAGAINEGDLQRMEVQKLEADQALDAAELALRAAQFDLAFLLGVRGVVPNFEVDTKVLAYAEPPALADVSAARLLRTAFDHRPDLMGLAYQRQQAQAQIELVERQKVPDITLGLNYAWGGFGGVSTNGPIQGPMLSFGLSAPLPVFYQLDGERRQAQAQYDTSALQQAKATAQVVNDVSTGYAAFVVAKKIVQRMEGPRRDGGGLLESSKGAFDMVAAQYEKGAASLTDYLDALRAYIATKNEYFAELANYWIAVFQLEAAVARNLR